MKILFLSDNFPPEVNAPAVRTFGHCREWVKQGHIVTVITSFPNFPAGKIFPGYKNRLWQREVIEGVEVIRIWTYIARNQGTIRRIVDYLSFAISSFVVGLSRRFDIVVATSPQFFTAVSGRFLSLLKRRPWIMEVRDLWPASIAAVGAIRSPRIISRLHRLELRLYRSAARIVVVTDAFKKDLVQRGINPGKIFVIKNGVDPLFGMHSRVAPEHVSILEALAGDRFVVGYVGTHGMAHGLDLVLRAAKDADPSIQFVLVGDGAEKARLVRSASEQNLDNVHFFPQVPREHLPAYLEYIDAAIVPLKNDALFATVIPSKIFEIAASGTPILLGVRGEAKELIEHYGAGISFEPENAAQLLEAIEVLRSDRSRYDSLQQGCSRLAADFSREKQAKRMLDVISG